VLFHVTANADWSSLPLSGLFVQMLERLAVSTRPALPEADDVGASPGSPSRCWTGSAPCATRAFAPVFPGEIMVEAPLVRRPAARPLRGGGATPRPQCVDVETELSPATWPASIPVEGMAVIQATDLMAAFLAAALLLLLVDAIAALWLAGRLSGPIGPHGGVLVAALMSSLARCRPRGWRRRTPAMA
jgi:hypothetical protein